MARSEAGAHIPVGVNDEAARRLAGQFDMKEGGLGTAPKFPNPSGAGAACGGPGCGTATEAARDAVLLTLDKMSQGGIYDHLGGGYARYSTDARWLVPHFEKMLYDNAQLLDLLTAAWKETGKPLYEARIRETDRLGAARDDRRRRRVRGDAGRRLRRRGGQVLRLDRGRNRRRARDRGGALQGGLRRDAGRQLGGQDDPPPQPRRGAVRRRATRNASRAAGRSLLELQGGAHPAGLGRQGARRLERAR